MPTPVDAELYNAVKQRANSIYSKPSAYKSGWIVRTYLALGGKYGEDGGKNTKSTKLKPKTGLTAWFKEKWKNVAKEGQYPVLRPTVRVSSKTPLLVQEIDPEDLKKKIKLKQKIKGKKNLSPFKPK